MAKKRIHLALRKVQVGRGDGWRVWTESLGCCCGGYVQQSGVSVEIKKCNSRGLCARSVSRASQKQGNDMERTRGHGVGDELSEGILPEASRVVR